MGNKPSKIMQMDRPESGGADHNSERENSGLLDRAKQEFAKGQKAKHAGPDGDQMTKGGKGAGSMSGAAEPSPRKSKRPKR
jgi:hypothetical protein